MAQESPLILSTCAVSFLIKYYVQLIHSQRPHQPHKTNAEIIGMALANKYCMPVKFGSLELQNLYSEWQYLPENAKYRIK